MNHYTGVGSRQTPDPVILLMEQIGEVMYDKGWTLRTGAAEGADQAFEAGASRAAARLAGALLHMPAPLVEVYLPWRGFMGRDSGTLTHPQAEAFRIAAEHHPAWDRLNSAARKLHARNVHQVLGPDVTDPSPSRFLLCWTYQARGGGGTGQAIRIARTYHVPVWDLGDTTVRAGFEDWVRDHQTAVSGRAG